MRYVAHGKQPRFDRQQNHRIVRSLRGDESLMSIEDALVALSASKTLPHRASRHSHRALELEVQEYQRYQHEGCADLVLLINSLKRSIIPQKRSPFHHFLASCTSRDPDRFNSRNHTAMNTVSCPAGFPS
jgi:hypothetical protein